MKRAGARRVKGIDDDLRCSTTAPQPASKAWIPILVGGVCMVVDIASGVGRDLVWYSGREITPSTYAPATVAIARRTPSGTPLACGRELYWVFK